MVEDGLRTRGRGVHKDTRRRSRGNQTWGSQWWRKLLLPRRGAKDSLLQPSALNEHQEKELLKRRATLRRAIEAPRTARTRHMITADWVESRHAAVVVKQRGSTVASMGEFENGEQYLWPEEALFLVDKGTLDLRVDGVPCSVQKAWSLCSGNEGRWLDKYLAYTHLRRAGYVVRRATGKPNGLPEEEGGRAMAIDFCVWRVGSFKRRVASRPLFCIKVFNFEDELPRHEDVAALCKRLGKTKVRAALVDRGVVVLVDLACNATPLSDRFVNRLTAERQAHGEEGFSEYVGEVAEAAEKPEETGEWQPELVVANGVEYSK